jgi:hypothetical protein
MSKFACNSHTSCSDPECCACNSDTTRKITEDRIEELVVDLRQQFFSSHMYGPQVIARAELLAKAAIESGRNLSSKECQ